MQKGRQKMKTKEMIKELTENPEKEFIRTRDGLVMRTDERGYLRWEEGHNWINLGDYWEEVKKPVDFMTAAKSGKRVRVEFSPIRYFEEFDDYYHFDELMLRLAERFCAVNLTKIIVDGKWYIEDQEGIWRD